MQQSKGGLGHSKHHKAFGKGNRNPRNNFRTAKELNAEKEQTQAAKERKKEKMFESVNQLMRGK
jgi:hypothetical protein